MTRSLAESLNFDVLMGAYDTQQPSNSSSQISSPQLVYPRARFLQCHSDHESASSVYEFEHHFAQQSKYPLTENSHLLQRLAHGN